MVPFSATITNTNGENIVSLSAGNNQQSLNVPTNKDGTGSKVRGGEFFLLALAVCYENDIYREATIRGIEVEAVEVTVECEFEGSPGCIAENVTYQATVTSNADEQSVRELIKHTDTVAEIHNSLRVATPVTLKLQ